MSESLEHLLKKESCSIVIVSGEESFFPDLVARLLEEGYSTKGFAGPNTKISRFALFKERKRTKVKSELTNLALSVEGEKPDILVIDYRDLDSSIRFNNHFSAVRIVSGNRSYIRVILPQEEDYGALIGYIQDGMATKFLNTNIEEFFISFNHEGCDPRNFYVEYVSRLLRAISDPSKEDNSRIKQSIKGTYELLSRDAVASIDKKRHLYEMLKFRLYGTYTLLFGEQEAMQLESTFKTN